MPARVFPTKRSISQVIRRHTPGSLLYLDEHSLIGQVRQLKGERDVGVDPDRLHAQVTRFLRRWEEHDGRLLNIDVDVGVQDLVPIAPQSVHWEPYPHAYRCVDEACQVYHNGNDNGFTGRCRRCGGPLRQLPYVYYHRCGSLNYLRPGPDVLCPEHGKQAIYFHDTRKFATSSWRCRECSYERRFFFPQCSRERCRAQDPEHPRVQASFWNDQWVHYGQTVAFINLDERVAGRFLGAPRGRSLLHLGVLGEIGAGRKRLQRALEDDQESCPSCGQAVTAGAKYCSKCGSRLPEGLFQGADYARGADLPIGSDDGRCAWSLLRDLEASRSLRDEVAERRANGTDDDLREWALERAEEAGIADVVLVTNFPITNAAIGFTRDRSGPPAWLRAFDRVDDKIPIYTQTVETEAWLVQVRAEALRGWLVTNAVEPFASELRSLAAHEVVVKEWFVERLARTPETVSPDDVRLQQVVASLLHSLSHVTLLSLATHSGLDASSLGEMLLTDALGFAIYAGDSDLGALTAAFEQLVGVVFTDAVQDYASCKFDPACSHDDGGACVGCIQLYRGCQWFNEDLSRAYLFGGTTGGQVVGTVRCGFFSGVRGAC